MTWPDVIRSVEARIHDGQARDKELRAKWKEEPSAQGIAEAAQGLIRRRAGVMKKEGHPSSRKMSDIARAERRCDVMWGVLNGGNALCAAVFRKKAEAEEYRKAHARAYDVVLVAITPLYE